MHACRAFLTNLSCLQPLLLKRRYVSTSPPSPALPSPLSLSLHCIDNIEYFHVVVLPGVVCWNKAAVLYTFLYVAEPLF